LVEVQIEPLSAESLEWKVRETGHFQNIVIESLGVVKLQAGTGFLKVRPKTKAAAAIADIRQIQLIPIEP
jgi:hypothetical protein